MHENRNTQLHIVKMIFVFSTAVPDKPRDLSIVNETWESVQLSWQPGFDGGYAQKFEVTVASPSTGYLVTYAVDEATVYNIKG